MHQSSRLAARSSGQPPPWTRQENSGRENTPIATRKRYAFTGSPAQRILESRVRVMEDSVPMGGRYVGPVEVVVMADAWLSSPESLNLSTEPRPAASKSVAPASSDCQALTHHVHAKDLSNSTGVAPSDSVPHASTPRTAQRPRAASASSPRSSSCADGAREEHGRRQSNAKASPRPITMPTMPTPRTPSFDKAQALREESDVGSLYITPVPKIAKSGSTRSAVKVLNLM